MKRAALTTNLIQFLALMALVSLCATLTPPKALADSPPSARAPLTLRDLLKIRGKIRHAKAHLMRMDKLIRDQELDLKVYEDLNPVEMDGEQSSYAFDRSTTQARIVKLRSRRAELAAAIAAADARYNAGSMDLQPKRSYASERD